MYMCQQMLRHKEPQASKHITLKPFGFEWRAATGSAVGEHHYGGEKKKLELYIKGVMANVKLPKFAQINELMNNSSA